MIQPGVIKTHHPEDRIPDNEPSLSPKNELLGLVILPSLYQPVLLSLENIFSVASTRNKTCKVDVPFWPVMQKRGEYYLLLNSFLLKIASEKGKWVHFTCSTTCLNKWEIWIWYSMRMVSWSKEIKHQYHIEVNVGYIHRLYTTRYVEFDWRYLLRQVEGGSCHPFSLLSFQWSAPRLHS